MKLKIIALLGCLATLLGCSRRQLPNATIMNPVFAFKGIVDGDSLTLQAGVNGYYMYTDYYKDAQMLTTLRGYFMQDTCAQCEPFLGFEVRDLDQTVGNVMSSNWQQMLTTPLFYSYSIDSMNQLQMSEVFQFAPDWAYAQGTSYFWDFGDGTTSVDMAPLHTFPPTGGNRTVKLVVNYFGLIDSIENTINTDLNSPCRTMFSMSIDSFNNLVTYAALPALQYAWSFGNGLTSSQQFDSSVYNNAGTYHVILTTTQNGCTSTFVKKIKVPLSLNNYVANYSYISADTVYTYTSPRLNTGSLVITYKNKGKTYVSYKHDGQLNQSTKPIFTVNNMSFFEHNEKGIPTIKVSGSIDTYLYNEQNAQDSIAIHANQVTFGLGYPE